MKAGSGHPGFGMIGVESYGFSLKWKRRLLRFLAPGSGIPGPAHEPRGIPTIQEPDEKET
jgi:hypothetical protein